MEKGHSGDQRLYCIIGWGDAGDQRLYCIIGWGDAGDQRLYCVIEWGRRRGPASLLRCWVGIFVGKGEKTVDFVGKSDFLLGRFDIFQYLLYLCAVILNLHVFYPKMKRFAYIVTIVFACTLMVLGALLCLISSSKVQTSLVHVVLQEVSRGLHAEVRVGRVEYKLFNRLEIDNIYLADQAGDTLLFVDTLQARFQFAGLFQKQIIFNEVALQDVVGDVHKLPNGETNIAFLQRAFSRTERAVNLPHVEVKNVTIDNARLRLFDYHTSNLQAGISLNCLSMDSIDAEIHHLRFTEHGGFDLQEFTAQLIVNKGGAWMPRLRLQLPTSQVAAQRLEIRFPQVVYADSVAADELSLFDHLGVLADADVLAQMAVDVQITHARVSPKDIQRLMPALKNVEGVIDFSGTVSGTLADLHATDLALDYEHHELLRGNVSLSGLPVVDTMRIQADLQDLRVDHALLQDLISDLQDRPYQLPYSVRQLGTMHYRGTIIGRLDDLHLRGAFSTRLGTVSTDGRVRAKEHYRAVDFVGHVGTKRFALGKLLGQSDLGNIAFRTDLHFSLDTLQQMRADLCAHISSLQYRDYTYQKLHVDGLWTMRDFKGKIEADDPNLGLAFDGVIDFTQALPVFDVHLDVARFRMGALNLSEKYADSDLRFALQLNAKGSKPDNMNGYIVIDTLSFRNKEKTLFMQKMKLTAQTDDTRATSFKIQSDYINTNITGTYTYSTLLQTLQGMLMDYMPKVLTTEQRKRVQRTEKRNSISYYVYLKDIDLVSDVLELPVSLTGFPTIKGAVDEVNNEFYLQVLVPELLTQTQQVNNITFDMNNDDDQLNLSLFLLKRAGAKTASAKVGDLTCLLQSRAKNDSLFVDFDFTNDDAVRNAGSVHLQTYFTEYASRPLINLNILPSQLTLNDSIWEIGKSSIVYTAADTTLQVTDFRFESSDRYILADGLASTHATDSIRFDLQGIVLDYILEYTELDDAAISFGGAATGWGVIYSLFKNPMFEADVRMDEASINGGLLGDATASARWNKEKKTVDIFGEVVEEGDTIAKILGVVTPLERAWDLDILADSVNLAFINGWTEGIVDNIEGRGFGRVHVFGKEKTIGVEGRALAQEAGIGLDMLGTKYYFTDSVFIDLDKIRFDDILLHDQEGNELRINGAVQHNGAFQDFTYNINITCQQALVMDLPQTPQDMFYGKVFATGNARIRGDEQECRIQANARTDEKTDFYLSLGTASAARDNSFITFVNNISMVEREDQTILLPQSTKPTTKVFLDLQVEATPAAQLTLIIDAKTGDRLVARGEGDMKLSYDLTTDDIKLYGNYAINSGSFFFTFQNVIRKEFTIRDGSRVFFTGDPMQMQIDANASYTTTASLRDLFGTDQDQMNTNRTTVPVNCILYLKDAIMNPTISFGIELPQSDETINSQVRSIISTEDMMMRQILYLLVFNRFYTPDYLQATTNTMGLNETYSLLSSTVTGQINDWISKMTNDFSVGFNMRAEGVGADATQEYETQFQYQYNNRLLINGNFGYRYNDISNQPLFGNLDVEYLLTPTGHWRAKAYTHTVDKYSLKTANTVQGVGFLFKYDFGGESKKAKRSKLNEEQQDTVAVIKADSIQFLPLEK